MFWKIRFRLDKSQNSPISTIRIDAETLRDACADVLNIYRNATILSYQEEDREIVTFDQAHILSESFPVDPLQFARNKQEIF